jgi:hypothetical protein
MAKSRYSSPREYIEARREHSDPRPGRRKEVLAPYFDAADLEKATLNDNTDFSEYLLERLRPRFPSYIADILDSGRVAVGVVNDPTPNAHLVSLDCGHAIIINAGLIEFVYRMTRALSTKFIAPNDDQENALPTEETSRIIFEIFDWYIGSWQRTGKEHAAGPHYQVSRTQFHLANNLAFEAECFFLVHEIGHLLCALSRTSSLDISALIDEGEYEETFADKFAFWVLMSAWGKPDSKDYHPELAFAGAFTALRMFEALHGYCERAYQKKFGGPHPDAGQRIVNLINWTWELCRGNEKVFERVTEVGSLIDFTLAAVQHTLDRPEFENYYLRSAEEVVNELEDLLTACTSNELYSDHMTFRERAHTLLSRGYPTLLMNRVVREIVEPLKAAGELSQEEFAALPDERKADEWRKMRKLMLLSGLVTELREPYQTLWLQALNLDQNSHLLVCKECGHDYSHEPSDHQHQEP